MRKSSNCLTICLTVRCGPAHKFKKAIWSLLFLQKAIGSLLSDQDPLVLFSLPSWTSWLRLRPVSRPPPALTGSQPWPLPRLTSFSPTSLRPPPSCAARHRRASGCLYAGSPWRAQAVASRAPWLGARAVASRAMARGSGHHQSRAMARSAPTSKGRRQPRHGQGLGPPPAARHGQELLHLAHRQTREARRRDEERGGRAAAFRLAGELPAQLLIAFSRKHQGPDCFFKKDIGT